MIRYTFTEGSRFAGDPQLIGQRVDELAALSDTGQCTTSDYVADAADPESPLHPTIEWDDGVAALSWRHHQARQVMRSIRVVVKGRVDPTPAFVSVKVVTDAGVVRGYAASQEVKQMRPDLWSEAESECHRQLLALRRRYAAMQRFDGIWQAVDGLDD